MIIMDMISEDLERYYRVPSDNRDLNYNDYFSKGKINKELEEYNSSNTYQLNKKELLVLLSQIGFKGKI